MSKIIKLSIMIIISLIACSKEIAWSRTDILIAKDSTKALQMEISLPATQFILGEPLFLQLIVRNISAEPIRLPYYTSLNSRYLSYTIEGPKKPGNLYNPATVIAFSPSLYPLDPEKDSFVLKQGEEERTPHILEECRIMVPGHYKVNVVLNIPQIKALVPPFFEGSLSASLEFDVLRPIGEDAVFLESLQNWFDAHKVPPEERCYYFLHDYHFDCTSEIFRKHPTSRIASWILVNEIMNDNIISPKKVIEESRFRYCNNVYKDYICDPLSPEGKKELSYKNGKESMRIKLQWDNKTIADILSRYPSAPFSASLAIQKAMNIMALGDESNGLKFLEKFIQECNDKKIISRECNWAKEFVELWAKRKQTK